MNRQTGIVLIAVNNGNPNGSFDDDGRPRVQVNGKGVISNVSLSRKIRDLAINKESPAWKFASSGIPVNLKNYNIYEDRNIDVETYRTARENIKTFLETYFDVRIKGATDIIDRIEAQQRKDDTKPKTKKGEHIRNVVRGPLSLTDAFSLNAVRVEEYTITRKVGESEDSSQVGTLARKMVCCGLYALTYAFDPNSCMKDAMPFIENDLEIFKRLLPLSYRLNSSCVRPADSVEIVRAYHVTHSHPLGSVPDSVINKRLLPQRKKPFDVEATSTDDDYVFFEDSNQKLGELAKELNVESIQDLVATSTDLLKSDSSKHAPSPKQVRPLQRA